MLVTEEFEKDPTHTYIYIRGTYEGSYVHVKGLMADRIYILLYYK